MTNVAASFTFEQFRSAASIILGGLIGALIGAPASLAITPPGSYFLAIAAIAFGFFTGYRRRHSVAFFYFALLSTCILAGLVALSITKSG